jgi:hypothetical protein
MLEGRGKQAKHLPPPIIGEESKLKEQNMPNINNPS